MMRPCDSGWHVSSKPTAAVVDQAADGENGLFQAGEYPVDLAIVDLGLPKLNGLTVVQRLRSDGRTMPMLILTARSSWQDKVVGLEAGADDYLVKPFEYPELAARIKALQRRSLKAASHVLTLGPIAVDFSVQSARLNGEAMDLTAFEYRLLEISCAQTRAGREQAGAVRLPVPARCDSDSNVLELLIGRRRRKLDPDGALAPIETLRGRATGSPSRGRAARHCLAGGLTDLASVQVAFIEGHARWLLTQRPKESP